VVGILRSQMYIKSDLNFEQVLIWVCVDCGGVFLWALRHWKQIISCLRVK